MQPAPHQIARALFAPMVFTRDDLRHRGWSDRRIGDAVRRGELVRLRRNRYAAASLAPEIAEAVRVGGRLTCLSLLRMLGIFVLSVTELHVHVARNSSRLAAAAGTVRVHWGITSDQAPVHAALLSDAIRHSLRCQDSRAALATLDSLLHHGMATMTQLTSLFEELPARFQVLLRLVDPSAASGPETFVRLMLRTIGAAYATQVAIPGVGIVDFVVDGWLIIECDSKEFHEGWQKQQQDRYRDLAAARLGYVTVRPLAADILHRPAEVQRALKDVIDAFGSRLGADRRTQFRKTSPEGAGYRAERPFEECRS
ncbi:MAG TPA: type IV toxin-antitoxin system AbiEi family antitoxin domain-containing protein [Microbacterium sp.]|nr:type IV toxin-antitoxin system AbiEi family antitoxin domain-containing protein [Microbacterium sp.]